MMQNKEIARCPVVFHGTLSTSIPGILKEGIHFTEAEPCFTTDLSLAYNKYARKGFNPPRFYSGETLSHARELVKSGLIPPQDSQQALMDAARGYWDNTDNSGAVFVVSTSNWVVGPGPTAVLRFDPARREVKGGITKWIYNHLSLYREAGDLSETAQARYRKKIQKENKTQQKFFGGPGGDFSSPRRGHPMRSFPITGMPHSFLQDSKFGVRYSIFYAPPGRRRQEKYNSTNRRRLNIPPCDVLMWLPVSVRFRELLLKYNRQSTGLEKFDNLEEKIKEALLQDIVVLRQASEEFKNNTLPGLILKETGRSAVFSALRRCFLSILKIKDWKIIKSDYVIPYEEDEHVFLRENEIAALLSALSALIRENEKLTRQCGNLITLLKELWQNDRLLDNPEIIYIKFQEKSHPPIGGQNG